MWFLKYLDSIIQGDTKPSRTRKNTSSENLTSIKTTKFRYISLYFVLNSVFFVKNLYLETVVLSLGLRIDVFV